MSIKITGDIDAWARAENRKQGNATLEMGIDILSRSIMNAPKASGALVRSGRVKKESDTTTVVSFGDNAVRYAKRRHYENKKNPQTLLYLQKAGETVERGNVNKYFR